MKRFLSPLPCSPEAHARVAGTPELSPKTMYADTLGEKKQSCIEQPENTRVPLESTKAQVQKPFPQKEELAAKTARLNELNTLPNPDKKEK